MTVQERREAVVVQYYTQVLILKHLYLVPKGLVVPKGLGLVRGGRVALGLVSKWAQNKRR